MRKAGRAAPLGLHLDAAAAEPLYRQIGAELRNAILAGRLPAGTILPSSRLMAAYRATIWMRKCVNLDEKI